MHYCDNRIDLVNHTATLTGSNIIVRYEYKKGDDNTTSGTKRIITHIFSPSGSELLLTFLLISMDHGYWY